jgi:precorrin-2 dehydrogenase / sirohydrochlorin ferrochelatase
MPLYPLFLDLTGRRCLVVGAGPVGQRKAESLIAAGAVVRIVSPSEPEVGHEWIAAEYEPAHLDDMLLAFAAAPPEVNARVVADARARGLWVNSATDPSSGDFILPAVRRAGRIEIAVGTAGASPRVSAALADMLADSLPAAWPILVDLLAELREEVRSTVPQEKRRDLWYALTLPYWLERIVTGNRVKALAEMREVVKAAASW